jgi:hypothetical protein
LHNVDNRVVQFNRVKKELPLKKECPNGTHVQGQPIKIYMVTDRFANAVSAR